MIILPTEPAKLQTAGRVTRHCRTLTVIGGCGFYVRVSPDYATWGMKLCPRCRKLWQGDTDRCRSLAETFIKSMFNRD